MRIAARFPRILTSIVVVGLSSALLRAEWAGKVFDGGPGEGEPSPKRRVAQPAGKARYSNAKVWVTVKASGKEDRSRIADAGVSIEEVSDGNVSGVATLRAVDRLHKMGMRIDRESLIQEFPEADKAFHTYEGVTGELSAIASSQKFTSLITIGGSFKGRAIQGVRFNTTAWGDQPSSKPGIVFLGTHHAREHLSTEVPLLLARWLSDNAGKPEIRRLIETRDIYIIPLINPDGAEYDTEGRQYHMHRKNMRDNGGGSVGVDLNRNYGFHWGEGGASPDPDDDIYRGAQAFSEPETQAVRNFVESHPNLKVLLSYHTFSELILYPWGHSYDPIPDGPALKAYEAMARKMAGMTGYTPEQSSSLYIASGDTTDWAWGARNIFSFTFELTPKSMMGGGFYPGAGAIAPTVAKNIEPALYLIGLADDPYRAGAAADERLNPFPAPLTAEGSVGTGARPPLPAVH